MFCIAVSPTYTETVRGELPGRVAVEFKAIFRRLTVAEFQALRQEILEQNLSDARVIDRVLVGWADVVDEAKAPIDFTPDALARVLQIAGVDELIVKAYFESFDGARRKN